MNKKLAHLSYKWLEYEEKGRDEKGWEVSDIFNEIFLRLERVY